LTVRLHPLGPEDGAWVEALVVQRWGAPIVVRRGRVLRPAELPGFAAVDRGRPIGLVTYAIEGTACEIVTIDALRENAGVGTALLGAVTETAKRAGCQRVWLVTTNNNLRALGFYQRRGFRLVALRPGAIANARKLKPDIALVDDRGLPIRDELELELAIASEPPS
jgi:ribosomal protein S18 acetylase RimI-like enzyme